MIRDIERKANDLVPYTRLLEITKRIHSQTRQRADGDAPKIYSVHAPEVECIASFAGAFAKLGKAHKKYEFGVKVGLVTTNKESFVLGFKALRGNPYDGHTLQSCIEQAPKHHKHQGD